MGKGRGRPRKRASDRQSRRIHFTVTPSAARAMDALAEAAGVKRNVWAKLVALKAAKVR